jgi:hypothetical protein
MSQAGLRSARIMRSIPARFLAARPRIKLTRDKRVI